MCMRECDSLENLHDRYIHNHACRAHGTGMHHAGHGSWCTFVVLFFTIVCTTGCSSQTIENYRYQSTITALLAELSVKNDLGSWQVVDELADTIIPTDKQWDKTIRSLFHKKDANLLWKLHYIIDRAGIDRFNDELVTVFPELQYPLLQYNLQILGRKSNRKVRKIALEIIENKRELLLPAAIIALGTNGKKSDIRRLHQFRESSNPVVRECLLNVIAREKSTEALDQILSFMRDPSPGIACKAIHIASQYEDERVRDHLISLLKESESEDRIDEPGQRIPEKQVPVQSTQLSPRSPFKPLNPSAQAALALRQYPGPETINALVNSLGYFDASIREFSIMSLGSLGNELAVPNVLPMLQDRMVTVRRAAAWCLGRLAQPIAIKYLKNVEKFDSDRTVRDQARIALEELQQYSD